MASAKAVASGPLVVTSTEVPRDAASIRSPIILSPPALNPEAPITEDDRADSTNHRRLNPEDASKQTTNGSNPAASAPITTTAANPGSFTAAPPG